MNGIQGRADEKDDPEVDRKLLELLVCPVSKTSLIYDRERRELISRAARLAFPVRGGVPCMSLEAARSLDDPPGTS